MNLYDISLKTKEGEVIAADYQVPGGNALEAVEHAVSTGTLYVPAGFVGHADVQHYTIVFRIPLRSASESSY